MDAATPADGGLCASPVLYDQELCLAAPDVGFCILAGREADAQSLAPGLRCPTALPPCGDDSVACRWGDASHVCDGMAVEAYNRAICSLWDAEIVTDVRPIPLD